MSDYTRVMEAYTDVADRYLRSLRAENTALREEVARLTEKEVAARDVVAKWEETEQVTYWPLSTALSHLRRLLRD